MYYSSLGLIQLGLHANIAISKDEEGNVFIMSTCDLSAGEYLIKPIELLNALKMDDGNLNISEWRRGIELGLSDQDTFMLGLLWKYFAEFVHDFKVEAFRGHEFEAILNSDQYDIIRLSLHQHGFNPSDWKEGDFTTIYPLSTSVMYQRCAILYKKLYALLHYFHQIVVESNDLAAKNVLYPLLHDDEEFGAYIRSHYKKRKREDSESISDNSKGKQERITYM